MTDRASPPSTAARLARALPWMDYGNKFSPFKLIVFLALFVPLASVAYLYSEGELGPRPINEAIHQIGSWAIKLIFLALAITPARRILQWPRLLIVRRMIGVVAFSYLVVHFLLYIVDQHFDLVKVTVEIAIRIYLTIGFVALLTLATLTLTSTDGMVRRLGGRKWRRLHQLGYAAALLAVIHHFMQSKVNVDEPWVMAGLFVWLMGYRALAAGYGNDTRVPLWVMAALGIVAGALTAAGEAIYYWIKLGVAPLRVLPTNLDLEMGPRPALIVVAIVLGLIAVGTLRAWQTSRVRLRPAST